MSGFRYLDMEEMKLRVQMNGLGWATLMNEFCCPLFATSVEWISATPFVEAGLLSKNSAVMQKTNMLILVDLIHSERGGASNAFQTILKARRSTLSAW